MARSVGLAALALAAGRPGPARGQVQLDPPGAGTSERPLPLGRVEVTRERVPCSDGALAGAVCSEIEVRCPDIPPRKAELAVTRSREARGTIFAHRGSDGRDFFHQPRTVQRYADSGFDVVQVRWEQDWQKTPRSGILRAACRPATVMQHVYETVHRSDKDRGYCALGHSAGGGAIAYALAHYGRASILDYAVIAAGPPFARIDYGCAPHTYDGPPRELCGALPQAPMELPPYLIDPWDNTWTCGEPSPHPDDLARWRADSIVSPGADFSYPRTFVDLYDCATDPNGTAAGAFFFASQLRSEHEVTCFTDCRVEDLGDDGWREVGDRLLERCEPRHR